MLTNVLSFFGGLGIFLYGTHKLSQSLQKLGASKMRRFLATITDTKIRAILSGIMVTFLLQSSTVTNIIVVGLVGETLISLAQAFGIVLGSAIGTTFTVQILTFDVSQYATLFIFIGAILAIFIKQHHWQSSGNVLLSIGFIFFGIGLITSSLAPLSEATYVLQYLLRLSEQPTFFLILSMLLTALMHSSAAVIMIGIAFVTSNVLSLESILPLVLGANIGSTLPVVISSLTSRLEGKKLAFFYMLFKTVGVILLYPFLFIIVDVIDFLPGNIERQIAHFHTLFNVGIVVLFFPFLTYVAALFDRLLPAKDQESDFTVYLDESLLKVPEEALIHSQKQILRLATMVYEQMISQLNQFFDGSVSEEKLLRVEEKIDESYVKIQQYLLKLGQRDLTGPQSTLEVKLLNILNDIEHIGDMVVRFINKVRDFEEKNIYLNNKDFEQLKQLIIYIEKSYQISINAFKNDNLELAKENIQLQSEITQFEKDIKFEHFNRLIHQQQHNPNISAVYLDTINQLFQIYQHTINISRTVLGLI